MKDMKEQVRDFLREYVEAHGRPAYGCSDSRFQNAAVEHFGRRAFINARWAHEVIYALAEMAECTEKELAEGIFIVPLAY